MTLIRVNCESCGADGFAHIKYVVHRSHEVTVRAPKGWATTASSATHGRVVLKSRCPLCKNKETK